MTVPDKETMRPRSAPTAPDSGVVVAKSGPAQPPQSVASDGTQGEQARRTTSVDELVSLDTLRELEKARLALATATANGHADRSIARESLEKAQDLGAEVFRLREQLKVARLDADESYSRVLDLEMGVRQEQARLAELRVQNEQLGAHLRQVLALHEQDGIRWQAELARVLKVHHQDTAVWQAEIERVQLKHQQDAAVWQGEVERVQLKYQQEAAVWQAEVERVQRTHQQEVAVWQAELDAGKDAHQHDNARWQAEFDRVRASADDTASILGEVLSSRSWRMTRGMRRVVERLQGRRWEEPKILPAVSTLETETRGSPDPHGDD